jgi:excisionase family DNA binding protein
MSTCDSLLTVREAAERLGLSEQTIRRKARSGEIAAFKTGSGRTARYRFYPADLLGFQEAHIPKKEVLA